MRSAALLLLSATFWGCASSSGLAHPPVAPSGSDAANPALLPPVEGTDFAVFRGDGTPSDLETAIAEAGEVEVVFFGEQHDDQMTHRLQTEVLRRLFMSYESGPMTGPSPHPGREGVATPQLGGDRTVVLSLEMFERDVQYVVDEYLADLITESHFLASARPWDFYEERYRPAVEFAKAHRLPVVAANAPRRYVNRASRLGRESVAELPESARAFLPPLPYFEGTAAYRAEWDALMGPGAVHGAADPFHGQTLWDATMAYSVAQALDRYENPLVLHFAGSFHVENFTGTPEALEHYRPGTRRMVLVGVPSEDLTAFTDAHRGLGDFVFLTRPMAPPSSDR